MCMFIIHVFVFVHHAPNVGLVGGNFQWKDEKKRDNATRACMLLPTLFSVLLISRLSISLFMPGHRARGLRGRSTFLETKKHR